MTRRAQDHAFVHMKNRINDVLGVFHEGSRIALFYISSLFWIVSAYQIADE